MTDPRVTPPDAELYGIMVAPFRGNDRLASRDTYDTWKEAAETASAMMDQECGEPKSPGYYVVRLDPTYEDPERKEA